MTADGVIVAVVNCDDGVPRLSRLNTLRLALELRSTDAPVDKWKGEDQASVKR